MVWDFMYPSQKVNHGSFTDDKLVYSHGLHLVPLYVVLIGLLLLSPQLAVSKCKAHEVQQRLNLLEVYLWITNTQQKVIVPWTRL